MGTSLTKNAPKSSGAWFGVMYPNWYNFPSVQELTCYLFYVQTQQQINRGGFFKILWWWWIQFWFSAVSWEWRLQTHISFQEVSVKPMSKSYGISVEVNPWKYWGSPEVRSGYTYLRGLLALSLRVGFGAGWWSAHSRRCLSFCRLSGPPRSSMPLCTSSGWSTSMSFVSWKSFWSETKKAASCK